MDDKRELEAMLEQLHIKEKAEAMQKKHTFWESQPVKQFSEEENSDAVEEGPVQVNQVRETSLDRGAHASEIGVPSLRTVLASRPSRTATCSIWAKSSNRPSNRSGCPVFAFGSFALSFAS